MRGRPLCGGGSFDYADDRACARRRRQPAFDLVDAATQRLQTAEPVAATKWLTGGSIEDPPRVEQVLAAVSADATGKNVDPAYVRQIFADQIDATEAIEYMRFAQWKLDPGAAPGVAPDLAASRDHRPLEHTDGRAGRTAVDHLGASH